MERREYLIISRKLTGYDYDPFNLKPGEQMHLFHDEIASEIKRYEEALNEMERITAPIIREIDEAQTLTAEDFGTFVSAAA